MFKESMEHIYTLGPKYSYSYNLAALYYNEDDITCTPTVGEVFQKVSADNSNKGIIPIENLINGSVRESFINLKKYPVTILRAFDYKIENILASNSEQFTTIASHPQPLAQCSGYVEGLKGVEIIETSSTSMAMELASKDSSVAAIGNTKAAEYYGVQIIKTDISDKEQNFTRFFEIASKQKTLGSGEKTSMVIRPPEDRAGILFEILSVFRIKNINLTKIESIPTGEKLNDYVFFIDIDGAHTEQRVQDAVQFLQTFAEVDLFGSYHIFTV